MVNVQINEGGIFSYRLPLTRRRRSRLYSSSKACIAVTHVSAVSSNVVPTQVQVTITLVDPLTLR